MCVSTIIVVMCSGLVMYIMIGMIRDGPGCYALYAQLVVWTTVMQSMSRVRGYVIYSNVIYQLASCMTVSEL